jgi:hypothetical protein
MLVNPNSSVGVGFVRALVSGTGQLALAGLLRPSGLWSLWSLESANPFLPRASQSRQARRRVGGRDRFARFCGRVWKMLSGKPESIGEGPCGFVKIGND